MSSLILTLMIVDHAVGIAVTTFALVAGAVLSAIEWTDCTWNPVSGCTRVSAGCDNCYAVGQTRRCAAFGMAKYQGLVNPGKGHFNGVVKWHPGELDKPRRWRKPRRVFVNSMSDLFHPGVPNEFIVAVFEVMRDTPRHQYQILTKRPERALEMERAGLIEWPPNVWFGTSVEDARVLSRVDAVRSTTAAVKVLSCEPLLGPLTAIDLTGIDWVIVGGESGPRARPMDPAWVRELRDLCVEAGVAFFFKQWGAYDETGRKVGKKEAGRDLDGRTWDEYPVDLPDA